VEKFEGVDFKGALKMLADKAGVPLEAYTKEMKEIDDAKDRLFMIMEESTKFYEKNLEKKKEALEYLKGRGLNEKSIKEFRIGYAEDDWRSLCNFLREKKYTDKEIEVAGLGKKPDDKEKAMYDRFRSRIMFPISDSSGRVIAFSGRIFGLAAENPVNAKYLNSPETPIFSKHTVLYGLDKAKDSIRKNNFSILVEGQMDLVLSHQAGYRNTIATSGTALSDSTMARGNAVSNLGLIRRLSPNIVLAFDADNAGVKASSRAGRIALSLGMDVKVAKISESLDPAELISKQGLEAWKEIIKNSKHLIEFLLDNAVRNSKSDSRLLGKIIREEVLPYVNLLQSAIERSHFLKRISDVSQIKENALEEDLQKIGDNLISETEGHEAGNYSSDKIYRRDYILRKLFGIIFWQNCVKEPVVSGEVLVEEMAKIIKVEKSDLLSNFEKEKDDLVFEAEVFYEKDTGLKQEVEELLSNLEEESLKDELAHKMKELHLAEMEKDKTKSQDILKDITNINNKIQNLKSKRLE
jgi:DNA primase